MTILKKTYSESKHINLSADVTNFKPVSIDKINQIIKKL